MSEPFTYYLASVFMRDYHGDKENYEAAFDGWLENLDNGELIEFANEYIRTDHKRIEERGAIRERDALWEKALKQKGVILSPALKEALKL